MSISAGTSENKMVFFSPDAIIAPLDPLTSVNQGDRVKLVGGKIVVTDAVADDWIGMADFQNPIASLGDTKTNGKVLLAGNVVYFDAPASETFTYGDKVYAYGAAGYYYPQAVTTSSSNSAKLVGTFVGLTAVTGGAGKRVAVKIVPSVVI